MSKSRKVWKAKSLKRDKCWLVCHLQMGSKHNVRFEKMWDPQMWHQSFRNSYEFDFGFETNESLRWQEIHILFWSYWCILRRVPFKIRSDFWLFLVPVFSEWFSDRASPPPPCLWDKYGFTGDGRCGLGVLRVVGVDASGREVCETGGGGCLEFLISSSRFPMTSFPSRMSLVRRIAVTFALPHPLFAEVRTH